MRISKNAAPVAHEGVFALEQMLERVPASRNALSAALGDADFDNLRQVSRVVRTTLSETSVLQDRLRPRFCCPKRSRCANALDPTLKKTEKSKPPPLRFGLEMDRHRDADGRVSRDSLFATLTALSQQPARKTTTIPEPSSFENRKLALRALHGVCPSLALDTAIQIDRTISGLEEPEWAQKNREIEYKIFSLEHANSWRLFCFATLGGLAGASLITITFGPWHSAAPVPPHVRLGALLLLGATSKTRWFDAETYLGKFCSPHLLQAAREFSIIGAFVASLPSFCFLVLGTIKWVSMLGPEPHSTPEAWGAVAAIGDFVLYYEAALALYIVAASLEKPLRRQPLDASDRATLAYWHQQQRESIILEQLWHRAPHQGREDRVRHYLQQTESLVRRHAAELLAEAQNSGNYEHFLSHIYAAKKIAR